MMSLHNQKRALVVEKAEISQRYLDRLIRCRSTTPVRAGAAISRRLGARLARARARA